MLRTSTDETMEVATPASTPKASRRKNEVKGLKLKWFKGSPNKPRSPIKLLKNAQKESSPQQLPLPARVVEFDIDGNTDRVGVSEIITMIDKDSTGFSFTESPEVSDDFNLSFLNMPFSLSPFPSGSKKGKGKGKLKPPGKALKDKLKQPTTLKLLTTNPNNNWSISESSESNSCSMSNKLPEAKFRIMEDFQPRIAPSLPNSYIRYMEKPQEELAEEVEYDIDEEDFAWLDLFNDKRREHKLLPPVQPENMEFLMDRLEKESYFQMQSTGMEQAPLIDDDAVCCICMDGECQNSNAILFCDMCNLAVHQECYGVPYIPEGQWLCRRCLQSPSRGVDCALCPNKGGAFKQTDDGRWAHVICAIWIPEVCFANTVFLEPVDSVNNIPPARWKLCCYICKQKGVGACIQCHKSNCYTAFHVTCAQQANLCMRMDTVREASAIIVKKTAYCDHHAPPEVEKKKEGDELASPRQKLKQTRKLLAEKRCALPVVSIPTIPTDRIAQIATEVSFPKKHQFMKRLMAYWKLKRQMRNGVPLLRRLQAASSLQNTISLTDDGRPRDANEVTTTSINYYRYWIRLRQDLEKARLLCELIRKREKLKRSFVHAHHKEINLKLTPLNCILHNVIDELMARDISEIFSVPVDTNEVVDYLNVIKNPIDLSKMKEKVDAFEYSTIDELEEDFSIMIRNCLTYNAKDTVFYKAGIRLRELGGIVIRQGRRLIKSIGINSKTGMHLPKRNYEIPVLKDSRIIEEVEKVLEGEERFNLPFEEHLEKLQELMDTTLSISHPLTRKNRFARVRHEIIRLRRLNKQTDDPCTYSEYIESRNTFTLFSDSDSVVSLPISRPQISTTSNRVKSAKLVSGRRRESLLLNNNTSELEATLISSVTVTDDVRLERSKARSLRPIKRKILAESPFKESPVNGSPLKESPVKGSPLKESLVKGSTYKESPIIESPIKESLLSKESTPIKETSIKRRSKSALPNKKLISSDTNSHTSAKKKIRSSSSSPSRKSKRRSSTMEALQIEIPSVSTPTKSSTLLSPSKRQKVKDLTPTTPSLTIVSGSTSAAKSPSKAPNKEQGFFNTPNMPMPPNIPLLSPTPKASTSASSALLLMKSPKTKSNNDSSSKVGRPLTHSPSKVSSKDVPKSPVFPIIIPRLKSSQHPLLSQYNARKAALASQSSSKKIDNTSASTKSSILFSKKTLNNINNTSKKSGKLQELEKQKNSKANKSNKSKTKDNSSSSPKTKSTPPGRPSLAEKKEKGSLRKTRSRSPDSSSSSSSSITSSTLTKAKYKQRTPSKFQRMQVLSPPRSPATPELTPAQRFLNAVTAAARKATGRKSPPWWTNSANFTNSPLSDSSNDRTEERPDVTVNNSNRPSSPVQSTSRACYNRPFSPDVTSNNINDPSTPKQSTSKACTMNNSNQSSSPKQSTSGTAQGRSPSFGFNANNKSKSPTRKTTSKTTTSKYNGDRSKHSPKKSNNNGNKHDDIFKQYKKSNTFDDMANSGNSSDSFTAYRRRGRHESDSSSDDIYAPGYFDPPKTPEFRKRIETDSDFSDDEVVYNKKGRNGITFSTHTETVSTLKHRRSPTKLSELLNDQRDVLEPSRSNNILKEKSLPLQRPPPSLNFNTALSIDTTNAATRPSSSLSPLSPPVREYEDEQLDSPSSSNVSLDEIIGGDCPEHANEEDFRPPKFDNFKPKPLDLVWAKYVDNSWFPGVILNPDIPNSCAEIFCFTAFPTYQEAFMKKPNCTETVCLVIFFEKNVWNWIENSRIQPLGLDEELDRLHLNSKFQPDKTGIMRAYERAILYRCKQKLSQQQSNGELGE